MMNLNKIMMINLNRSFKIKLLKELQRYLIQRTKMKSKSNKFNFLKPSKNIKV